MAPSRRPFGKLRKAHTPALMYKNPSRNTLRTSSFLSLRSSLEKKCIAIACRGKTSGRVGSIEKPREGRWLRRRWRGLLRDSAERTRVREKRLGIDRTKKGWIVRRRRNPATAFPAIEKRRRRTRRRTKEGTLAINVNPLTTPWRRWRDSIASLCWKCYEYYLPQAI